VTSFPSPAKGGEGALTKTIADAQVRQGVEILIELAQMSLGGGVEAEEEMETTC